MLKNLSFKGLKLNPDAVVGLVCLACSGVLSVLLIGYALGVVSDVTADMDRYEAACQAKGGAVLFTKHGRLCIKVGSLIEV